MDALLETIAAGVAGLYRDREIPEIQEVEDRLGRMLTQQEYEQAIDTLNRVTEMIDESAEKRARTLASDMADERVRELESLEAALDAERETAASMAAELRELKEHFVSRANAMAAQIIAENAPAKRSRKPRSRKPTPAPLPDASPEPDPGPTPVIDLTLVGRLRKKLPLADAIERATMDAK